MILLPRLFTTNMSDYKISQFKSAIKEISSIDDVKLNLLATRLAQRIVTGGSSSGNPFSDEERSKLEASLEMSAHEVDKVIAGLQEFFLESAYHKLGGNVLESKLTAIELDASKVSVLVGVWTKAMHAVCEALSRKSVFPQVGHIAYNLSVEAGSDTVAAEKNIRGHIQLGLKDDDNLETLDLEFTHDELYDLHSQLTRVVSQLDAIADK